METVIGAFQKIIRDQEAFTRTFTTFKKYIEGGALSHKYYIRGKLQRLREQRARENEHCIYSSNSGCQLIKRIASGFYYKYNQRPYNMKTLKDFQQEAFLAMLENREKYQAEEKPEEFIFKAIRSHFKAIFQAANTKARAIDNNRYSGKVEYINPGLSVISCTVFNTWDIDLMLTEYISSKAGETAAGFIYLSERDKSFLKGELLQDMQQAVEQLPDLQRDIIKLYYLQGETIKDICKLLHISTAREQRTKREALKALREQLFNKPVFYKLITPKVKIKKPPLNEQQQILIKKHKNYIKSNQLITYNIDDKTRPSFKPYKRGICSGSSFFPIVGKFNSYLIPYIKR